MTNNSKELERIYEFAQEKRIALTQDEFSKMLGFKSRNHLFGRVIKSKEGVSEKLLKKAKDVFYNTTKSVTRETEKVPINITNNSDPPLDLIERIEKLEKKLESKDEQLENAAHAYSTLRKEHEDLKIKYNELKNVHPSKKTGTHG